MLELVLESIFWLGVLAATASWLLYPLVLYLVSVFLSEDHGRFEQDPLAYPVVTVLVTVHNEEGVIRRKIENTLSLDYPEDRFEILIVSDRSDDATEDIVREYEHLGVRLFRPLESCGKTDAQNQALPHTRGTIIQFTDAETLLATDFLKETCKKFSDPAVGCVAGELHFLHLGKGVSSSQNLYWRFELWLRSLESSLGILTAVPGASMAVRRDFLREMDVALGEDDIIPLDIICQGGRIVQSKALATDVMPCTLAGELNNRIRLTTRAWQATMSRKSLLNPLSFPGVALGLMCHRILRWMTPFFLLSIYFSSLALGAMGKSSFLSICVIQTFLYCFAAIGWLGEVGSIRRLPLCKEVFTFMLANTGFFIGIIKSLKGHKITQYKSI